MFKVIFRYTEAIDKEVRRMKDQAVDEDRTMSAIMADALRVYLSAHPLRGPR